MLSAPVAGADVFNVPETAAGFGNKFYAATDIRACIFAKNGLRYFHVQFFKEKSTCV
jgi:hypothetical protein